MRRVALAAVERLKGAGVRIVAAAADGLSDAVRKMAAAIGFPMAMAELMKACA